MNLYKTFRSKIKNKIIVIVCLQTFLIVTIGLVLGYLWGAQLLRNQVGCCNSKIAKLIAKSFIDQFDTKIYKLKTFVKSPYWHMEVEKSNLFYKELDTSSIANLFIERDKKWVTSSNDDPLIKEYLDTPLSGRLQLLVRNDPGIAEVLLTDKFGGLAAASGKTSDFYQADEEWWQKTRDNTLDDIFIGNLEFDISSNTVALPISLSLRNNEGDFLGICKFILDAGNFFYSLKDVSIEQSGHAALIDKNGSILYHEGVTSLDKKFCTESELKQLLHSKKKWALLDNPHIHNENIIAAYSEIDYHLLKKNGLEWIVVFDQHAKEVFSLLNLLIRKGFVLAVILLVLLIPLGILVGNYFTRPLLKLNRATGKIKEGDYDYKLGLKTGDEFEEVAISFNEMVCTIKESQNKLKEFSSTLEKRVEERTYELKQSQRSLEISNTNFFNITENNSDAIIIVNHEGIVCFLNSAAEIIFNRTSEDFIGTVFGFPISEHDSIIEINRKDKSGIIAEMRVTNTVWKGEDARLIVVRDITKRVEAEKEIRLLKQRMEFILDVTNTRLDIIDTEFTIQYIDPAGEKIYGDFTDKKCYEYFMGKSEPCPGCGMITAFKTKEIGFFETNLVKENNRPVRITSMPFRNDDGKWLAAEIKVDITEYKRIEEEKAQLLKDLLQAQKLESIGTLAAGIAHEINTPLQFINNNTNFVYKSVKELLKLISLYKKVFGEDKRGDEYLDEKQEIINMEKKIDIAYLMEEIPLALSQSKEGLSQASNIVSAMKDFSHMGDTKKVESDINKAIGSTITISRNEWKYNADMQTNLDSNLPLVPCFIGEIKQVLLNLIVNASHAIADARKETNEKGLITIVTSYDDRNATINITDTGLGIPEEIHDKIFTPFFTTKEVGKGTGQGLSIAYATIVKRHDGTLSFETEWGKGTSFFITLPYRA